jgi:hypothetical protein
VIGMKRWQAVATAPLVVVLMPLAWLVIALHRGLDWIIEKIWNS